MEPGPGGLMDSHLLWKLPKWAEGGQGRAPESPGQQGPDGEQSQGNQVQKWMTENSPGHGADPALCSLSVWAKHLTVLSMSLKRLVSAWPRPLSSVDTSDEWHSEEASNSLQGLQGTARPATHLSAPVPRLSTPVPSPPCGSTTHLQAGLLPRSRLAVRPVRLLGEAHWLKPPPWPATIVTICTSCLTTGGPGKEHGTNEPPPTGRVQERSKGDTTCPTTSQNPSLWHPSWLNNACPTRKDPESEWLAKDSPETNPITIKPETAARRQSSSPGFPYPTALHLGAPSQ